MRAALADIADLEGCISPELALDRQVPLIGDRRLHVGIPNTQEGDGVARVRWRVAGCSCRRTHNSVRSVRARQCLVVVNRIDFGWSEGGVQGQTQVRAGTF